MKIVFFLLIAYTLAQNENLLAPNLEMDFNNNVIGNLQDKVNADLNADLQEQYQKDLQAFLDQTEAAVNDMNKNTKEVPVGRFIININKSCVVEWPTGKPEYNPVEFECIKGTFDGELLAKSIASMTQQTPVSPFVIQQNLVECKLNVDLTVSFSIYHNCENEEFIASYNKYFTQLKQEMLEKGYVWVQENENENGAFVYKAQEEQTLMTAETIVKPA